jgi:hypothetical protein
MKVAARMHMPHPQALAAWRLAESLPQTHPERAAMLALAETIFQKLGARFELDQFNTT